MRSKVAFAAVLAIGHRKEGGVASARTVEGNHEIVDIRSRIKKRER